MTEKINFIESAVYGSKDVTDILNDKIKKGLSFVLVGNDLFGDPTPGVFKYLDLIHDGKKLKIPENQTLILSDHVLEEEGDKSVIVVIFCWAVNDWKDRLIAKINRMINSGLYDAADEIYLTITDTNNQEEDIRTTFNKYNKLIIEYHTDNIPEYWGIKKIDDLGKTRNNTNLLYSHVKGVYNKFKNFSTKEISQQKINSINDWAESLDYFTIDRWKDCVDKLNNGFDTVGVTNIFGWWWGNFWWTKSSHIKKNIEYKYRDRWYGEAWLHEGNISPSEIKKYEMWHYEFDPQGTDCPRFFYDGSYSFEEKKPEIISAFFGFDGIQRDEAQPPGPENLVDVTNKVKDLISEKELSFVADEHVLCISDPSINSLPPHNKCLIINYKLPDIPDRTFRLKTFSGFRTKIGW